MSHNLYGVGDKGASVEGSITIQLDDLGDVGAVSDGQTLAYDSASSSTLSIRKVL